MKIISLMLLAILLPTSDRNAQSWRVYSPPDKSFSIELPAPLHHVSSFEGKHGASTEEGLDVLKNVSSYAALQSAPKNRELEYSS